MSWFGKYAGRGGKFVLAGLLLILVVCTGVAAPRELEYSRYVHTPPAGPAAIPTPRATYFRAQYRFGGGVVPHGAAEFQPMDGKKTTARDLRLTVLDPQKLTNGRPDADAIGLTWDGNAYPLAAVDDMILPLMEFVDRGSYIAYTIPVAGFDEEYFKASKLMPRPELKLDDLHGYVAQEFDTREYAKFLHDLDLRTRVQPLPADVKARIMANAPGRNAAGTTPGSYVNADFDVRYVVFLDTVGGKRVADVGGLPLRYDWSVAKGGGVIDDVDVFVFPDRKNKAFWDEEHFELQYKAVLFFQTAAVLRQFRQDNKDEFDRFKGEVRGHLRGPGR